MSRPTLPTILLDSLGIDATVLPTMSAQALRATVEQFPALASYYDLLHLNARVAASHLMLAKKFLFKPSRARDEAQVADSPLVSNHAGTTGMIERLLERLTQARKAHLLFDLHKLPPSEIAALAGINHEPRFSSDDLTSIVHFIRLFDLDRARHAVSACGVGARGL
jgi:hypothetical protein